MKWSVVPARLVWCGPNGLHGPCAVSPAGLEWNPVPDHVRNSVAVLEIHKRTEAVIGIPVHCGQIGPTGLPALRPAD